MNDTQLKRYLNSVGKRCFVEYFDRFATSLYQTAM